MSGLHHLAAHHLATKGRGPDTMLVHMAPSEVNSLRGLAQHAGADLTVNPDTGLPEAGVLSSILPMVLGAALTATGVGAPIAAAMVGAGTGAITGDLKQGLMAGLGAFGGGALGGAIKGATAASGAAASGLADVGSTAATTAADVGTTAATTAADAAGTAAAAAPGALGEAATAAVPNFALPAGADIGTGGLGNLAANIGDVSGTAFNAAPGALNGSAADLLGAGASPAAATPAASPFELAPDVTPEALQSSASDFSGLSTEVPKDFGKLNPNIFDRFADEAKIGSKPSMWTTGAAGLGLLTPFEPEYAGAPEEGSNMPKFKGPYTMGERHVIAKDPNDTSTSEHQWFDKYMPDVLDNEGNALDPKRYEDALNKDKKGKGFAEGGATSPGGKGAQSAAPAPTQSVAQSGPGGKGAQGGQMPSGDNGMPNYMAPYTQALASQSQGMPQQNQSYDDFMKQSQGVPTPADKAAAAAPAGEAAAATVPQGGQDAYNNLLQQAQYSPGLTGTNQGTQADADANTAAIQAAQAAQGVPTDPNALPIGGQQGGNPYAGLGQMQQMWRPHPYGRQMQSPGGKGAQAGATSPSSYADGGPVDPAAPAPVAPAAPAPAAGLDAAAAANPQAAAIRNNGMAGFANAMQQSKMGGKGAQKQGATPGGKGSNGLLAKAMQQAAANKKAPTKMASGGTVNLKKGAFVLDARTVSEVGNGSSGAGLDVLKQRLGAKAVRGKGDGVSDDIPARIGAQPARVARDEAIVPPKSVARLGGGNPKKGADKLYAMMDHAHKMRASAKRGQNTKVAGRFA